MASSAFFSPRFSASWRCWSSLRRSASVELLHLLPGGRLRAGRRPLGHRCRIDEDRHQHRGDTGQQGQQELTAGSHLEFPAHVDPLDPPGGVVHQRAAKHGLRILGRHGQAAGDPLFEIETAVDLDRRIHRSTTAEHGPGGRQQGTQNHRSHRPDPQLQAQRPELVQHDQPRGDQQGGKPGPPQHTDEPLGTQPPLGAPHLLSELFHDPLLPTATLPGSE